MDKALADFRIENDSVVLLSFVNGSSYRVNPNDLEEYLAGDDINRVRRAIKLRKQFMRRVLPPTLMIVLAAGIVGLGGHDIQRIQAITHAKAPAIRCIPVQTAPHHTGTPSPSTASATLASGQRSDSGGSGSSVGQSAASARSITPAAGYQHSLGLVNRVVQPVTQATAPVAGTVQQVVAPVTDTVRPVANQAVSPVTKTVSNTLAPLL